MNKQGLYDTIAEFLKKN